MSGIRVPDVLVATLAGLGVVTIVDALGSPVTALLVRSGMYEVNNVIAVLVSLVAAAVGAATAVVVHELRLAPGVARGPLQWLVVGLPTVLVLGVVAMIGSAFWGSVGPFLAAFGVQLVGLLVGAGSALVAGSVLRSRSAARTPAVPTAAPH